MSETQTPVKTRPPVVTLMGHVDHGKTSLLDAIRGSQVAEKEFGGITQHISAYQIEHKGKIITFIDTPGHEVFYQMRSHGARVTDIVILVVAADDGVMPQTKESIHTIKESGSPFVVAVNKMDAPGANVDRVKQQLAENEVLVEGYGGNVPIVPVSAKTKEGIDELLEIVLLMTELEELKDSNVFEGVVIESHHGESQGPLALILVKSGQIKIGDTIYTQTTKGKVKSLYTTFPKEKLEGAGASTPVEVSGLEAVPKVGETVSHDTAVQVASDKVSTQRKLSLADLIQKPKIKVKVILRADVQGSVEAIEAALKNIETESELEIIRSATGDVSDSDVLLSSGGKSLIIGFNVDVPSETRKLAAAEKVSIKTYNLIYELLDDIEKNNLSPTKELAVVSRAEVLKTFDTPSGKVAGLRVTLGTFKKNDTVKISRSSRLIGNTKIGSIRHGAEVVDQADEAGEYGFLFNPELNFDKGDVVEMEA